MKKDRGKLSTALGIIMLYVLVEAFFSCMPGNPSEEGMGAGCSASSGDNPAPPPMTKIFGILKPVSAGNPQDRPEANASTEAASLTEYKLYCVTITEPVAEGSDVSDASGNVIVILSATSPAFGCNIQDANGKGVASLFFSDNSGHKGQTISGSGDIDLGTINFSTMNGVAQATIPSNAAIVTATPPGVPCPKGAWVGAGWFTSECNPGQDVIITTFVTKTASGNYVISYSMENVWIDQAETICGTTNLSNIPATYSGGVLTANFGADPDCPSRNSSFNMSMDASCQTATATATMTSCVDCSFGNGGCSGCGGSETCTPSFTATRQ